MIETKSLTLSNSIKDSIVLLFKQIIGYNKQNKQKYSYDSILLTQCHEKYDAK